MTKKAKWLLLAVAALMIAYAAFLATIVALSSPDVPYLRLYSDMSLLDTALREELQKNYEKEGRYPDRVDVLAEAVVGTIHAGKVPEKPKELDPLPRFEYTTDGETCTMTWSMAWRRGRVDTYKDYGRHGTWITFECYTDGELGSRQDLREDKQTYRESREVR